MSLQSNSESAPPLAEAQAKGAKGEPVAHLTPTKGEFNYWQANLHLLAPLLLAWFVVSFGAGILFVDELNAFHVPFTNAPLGMWMAQQGSIYAFVVIIYVYVRRMAVLDRKLGLEEGED